MDERTSAAGADGRRFDPLSGHPKDFEYSRNEVPSFRAQNYGIISTTYRINDRPVVRVFIKRRQAAKLTASNKFLVSSNLSRLEDLL